MALEPLVPRMLVTNDIVAFGTGGEDGYLGGFLGRYNIMRVTDALIECKFTQFVPHSVLPPFLLVCSVHPDSSSSLCRDTTSSKSGFPFLFGSGILMNAMYRLGQGGFGTVRSCRQRATGQLLAAKMIRVSKMSLVEGNEYIRRECEIVKRLRHVSLLVHSMFPSKCLFLAEHRTRV